MIKSKHLLIVLCVLTLLAALALHPDARPIALDFAGLLKFETK